MELLNLELLARSLEVNYRTTFRHHRGLFFGLSIKHPKSNYSAIKLMTFAQQTKKVIMKTIVSVIP